MPDVWDSNYGHSYSRLNICEYHISAQGVWLLVCDRRKENQIRQMIMARN